MNASYSQAKAYFDTFVDYERMSSFGYQKCIRPERMQVLARALTLAVSDFPVIHIAGTKGKGSTAHMCAWLLANPETKVGLYTSPHFFDVRERIQIIRGQGTGIRGQLIEKKELARITAKIRPIIEKLQLPEHLGKISFFEVYTALAFSFFLQKKVDVAIFETGLGGRLDATNIAKPQVCVLTPIGYDHTALLGTRLSDIAFEKAGIIKSGVPVVAAPQRRAAEEVIRRVCRRKQAPLFRYGREFQAVNIRITPHQSIFDFHFQNTRISNIRLPVPGACQIENAACAIASCILFSKTALNLKKLKASFSGMSLPGRFETISRRPTIIVDVAHNASSFVVLGENCERYFPGKKIILVFGCCRDKDAKAMLKTINYDRLVLSGFDHPRAFLPADLIRAAGSKRVSCAVHIRQALEFIKQWSHENASLKDAIVLVSGSHFLVSEAKAVVEKKRAIG